MHSHGIVDPGAGIAGNPIAPDAASVARGRELFATHCAGCHGDSGRGDGPDGEGLSTRPADLVVHVPLHPDRELYSIVRFGLGGTDMAGFTEELTQDEVWHLLNYLRTPRPIERLLRRGQSSAANYPPRKSSLSQTRASSSPRTRSM